jgi:hypothetical protein
VQIPQSVRGRLVFEIKIFAGFAAHLGGGLLLFSEKSEAVEAGVL